MNHSFEKMLVLNAPELFEREDMQDRLHDEYTGLATWHIPGSKVGEFSDVFLKVEVCSDGTVEISDDLPEYVLGALTGYLSHLGEFHGILRLTNIEE